MHPRTLILLIVLIIIGAFGLRFVVTHFSLLPVSEEAVLKRSVAVSVAYNVKGNFKSLTIDEPGEVRELLGTLRIQSEEYRGNRWGVPGMHSVKFHFPNGAQRDHTLDGPTQLGEYVVDRAFYNKLNEIVSRHEGRPIDVGDNQIRPVPPPDFNPNFPPP